MILERRAGRVLLLAEGSVLLIKGFDPARPEAGTWWLTPGGGADDGETIEAAAAREVPEETGFQLDRDQLGPVIATRVAAFDFEGRRYRQTEWFFAVEVTAFTPRSHGWDDLERRSLLDHRWWTVDELRNTRETVYPRELADVAHAVLDRDITGAIRLSGL
jgi:8-oxo-dGTP pyrophosphatase MutT (NUDIX family)